MKESKFTGSAWGIFGWGLLMSIAASFFIFPVVFVIPLYFKWYYEHVTIDGEQLEFEHEGPYWGFLGWMIFIFVTFGLGAFYASKKMIQWQMNHTHIKDVKGEKSNFDGSAWGILGYGFLTSLSLFFFIIPFAWVYVMITRWYNEHTILSGRRLKLDYQGPWFGALGWMLFSIVTFGLGSFYAQKRLIQFQFKHTHFVFEQLIETS